MHAVYLGGGTPTVLAPKDLERLLTAIRRSLPVANDCEMTIETTAADLDEETLSACIAGGANRFSVGVQSFDTAVRKNLGRRSDREKVLESLQRARDRNAAAIIIDLIYGLPGQNMTVWESDMETFLDLEIDGADSYQLEAYFKELAAGRKPLSGMLAAPPQKPLINAIAGGLETGYLNMEKIRETHGVDLEAICAPLLEQWEKTGLIHRDGGRFNLTLPRPVLAGQPGPGFD